MNKSANRIYQNTFPVNPIYFKEELSCETLNLSFQKPDIEMLLDVVVEPEVIGYKIIDTPVGVSNENQKISGVKLVVELNLKGRILYTSTTCGDCAENFESFKSIFIVIPSNIKGDDIHWIEKTRRFIVTPYIEHVMCRMIDCRNVQICSMLFVNVTNILEKECE